MMGIFKSETIITGNTYAYRELFRRLGGKWDADRKAWVLPPLTMRERGLVGPLRGCNVEKS